MLVLTSHQKFLVEMKLFELDLIPFLRGREKYNFLQGINRHRFKQYTRKFRKLKKKISRRLSIGYKILDERFVFYLIAHINNLDDSDIRKYVELFILRAGGNICNLRTDSVDFLRLKKK
jgi:hypothetical protein